MQDQSNVLQSNHDPWQMQRARFRAAFLSVAPAMFLGSLDQTIIAAALPIIARAFGSLGFISWVVTAYLLAATVAAPIYGRLGDAFGRHRVLLYSLAVFLCGSLLCALAPTLTILVVGRSLQGFGGGGLMTLSQALIGEVVSPKERGRFQGWFGAVFALASTIGPAGGGVMAQYLGWRSIFWINLPLVVLAGAAASRVKVSGGSGSYHTDLKGIAFFVGGTITFLLVLTFGGHEFTWLSSSLGGLFALSVICFFAFCRTEHRSQDPLLTPKIVENPIIWRSTLAVLINTAVLFGLVVQFPLFLQYQFGLSTTISGILLIPLTAAQVAVSTATGLRISSSGRPKPPIVLGLSTAATGFCVLTFIFRSNIWAVATLTVFIGAGLGALMPAAQTLVQWAAGTQDLGEATAFISFARSVGGVFGTAVSSAVLIAGSAGGNTNNLVGGPLHFKWMFATLGSLATIGTLVAVTLPNVNLSSPVEVPQKSY